MKVGGQSAFTYNATLTEGYVGFGGADGDLLDFTVKDGDGTPTEYSTSFGSASLTLVTDARGNQTFDGVYYFKYDYRNRLAEVHRAGTLTSGDFYGSGSSSKGWLDPQYASKVGSQIAAYSYDGLNRRIRKVVTNSGARMVGCG